MKLDFQLSLDPKKTGLYSPTIPTMPTSAIKQFSLNAEPLDRVGCHNRVGATFRPGQGALLSRVKTVL